MRKTVKESLRAGLFVVVMIAGVWMPGRALGVDEVISQPAVGESFPPSGTPSATKARIIRVGNLDEANFPTYHKFHVPPNCELEFQAVRASGDWDTHRYGPECNVVEDPVADTLHDDWPRWKCNIGSFVDDDDLGTTVVWTAPASETAEPGVEMQVYEDDDGTTPPGVADIGISGYGIKQDYVRVKAVALAVTLTINTAGATTNGTHPQAPDSRGQLGLWNAHPTGKNDMRERCTNHLTGDVNNGGADYVSSTHPFRYGTCLKTEIYARSDKRPFDGNVFQVNLLQQGENWRIGQEYYQHIWWTPQGASQPTDTSTHLPPTWHDDGGYRTSDSVDSRIECSGTYFFDFLYNEDAPGIREVPTEALIDGDVLRMEMHFRTWVEFCYLGSWVAVTPVPEPEGSGDYSQGKPMWGMTGELTGTASGPSISLTATPNAY